MLKKFKEMWFQVFLWTCVSSYSYGNHKLIGRWTDRFVNNSLFEESIEQMSPWADLVKNKPEYRWTKPLHYINSGDNPPETCWIKHNKTEINLMNGIRWYWNSIQKRESDIMNVKMFIHLYQDLFQPLHTTGKARGGNDQDVLYFGQHTSLHRVWDTLLLRRRVREFESRDYYLDFLQRKYVYPDHNCDDFEYWLEYVNGLNCDYVWLYDEISYEYYDRVKIIIDELVYTSGWCLSELLNKL